MPIIYARRAPSAPPFASRSRRLFFREAASFGRRDDTVGNPHRAQISQFDFFELVLLLKLVKQYPVEQFEASRAIRADSTSVSSTLPPLIHRTRQTPQ